jgi:thiol:disulfide interchange protein
MRPFLSALSLGLLLLLSPGCTTSHKTPATRPQIYDPRADGEQQLRAALATARKQHKRVLLNLGANWCGDSQAMFRLLNSDPAVRDEIRHHFVLAMVDVNQKDGPPRNQAMVQRFSNPLARGIPVLLILDAQGTLLNRDPNERLADNAHKQPADVLDYLRKWATLNPEVR